MKSTITTLIFIFINLIACNLAISQEKTDTIPLDSINLSKYYDMSLEQLDSIKASGVSSELEKFINSLISISTQKSLSTRNNPNVVTLITREEIQNSGARDLIDVLRLVPGFCFAQDRHGKIGLGVRGNWANEGKVSFRIDDVEMNEHYTAHAYFGNHYPVDLIERIEIIRGPGSAVYGGFAEFSVINIITRNADKLDGIAVSSSIGVMAKSFGRQNYSIYGGKKIKDLKMGFSMSGGIANMSDNNSYSFYKTKLQDSLGIGAYNSMANQSHIEQLFINGFMTFKGFSIRNISDLYRTANINYIDENNDYFQKLGLIGNYTEIKYYVKILDNLSLTPKVNINIQTPWEEGTAYSVAKKDTAIHDSLKGDAIVRLHESLIMNWDINHRINLILGGEIFTDLATNSDTNSIFYAGDSTISYTTYGIYSQAIFKLPFVNFITGIRYEINSFFEPSFVPRVGITKKYDKFHYKLLLSGAFRAPTIGNIYHSFDGNYNVRADSTDITIGYGIEPEKTYVIEAEFGLRLDLKTYLTFNLFNINTENPIVYASFQDETFRKIYGRYEYLTAYTNYEKTGSKGFEIDLRHNNDWGYFNINYSYYTVRNSERIPAYSITNYDVNPDLRIEQNSFMLLAFPNHKLNLNLCYKLSDDLSANITFSYFGKRYGYDILMKGDGFDENGNPIEAKNNVDGQLVRINPNYLINVFVSKKNFLTKGLSFGIGGYNLLNEDYKYYQPYFGLNPALPGPSREIVLKLSYEIPFKNFKKK
ncbi:MAG: TonB-dependent receptor [Saprospiraceae bacterium]|nr:TonB-dependent receptor [Saprospiraceae bacterium]